GDGRAVAACWSADGKAFFLTDAKGTVRRVATDGLKEEARAEVGVKADRLLLSAEGLLVPALEQQVIHLLGRQTLKPKGKVEAPGMTDLAAAPAASVAVAARRETGLLLIDLKTGKVLKDYTGKEPVGGEANFEAVRMTPDGKFVFGTNGQKLH